MESSGWTMGLPAKIRKTVESMDSTSIPATEFRQIMGQFATGVTIITTRDGHGTPQGLTINSFASLSLDPPLVMWSLRLNSTSLAAFRGASHFAINILSAEQEDTSKVFARPGDRFAGIDWQAGDSGVPLLKGSLAWIECERFAEYPGGDHVIFVGRVVRARHFEGAPLLYWRGAYFPAGDKA